MKLFLFLTLTISCFSYEFRGKHFIAEYYDCEEAMITSNFIMKMIMEKAIEKSNAHVLSKHYHNFPHSGMTGVYLLSESHASIHTYPEKKACFIDLFTCGENCSWEEFDKELKQWLRPRDCKTQVLDRGQ